MATLIKLTAESLATALIDAELNAHIADPGDFDGLEPGTSNLDCPVIRIKGARKSLLEEAQKASGVTLCGPLSGFWRGFYFVNTTRYGQADRRSAMAEAAYRSLRDCGIKGLEAHFYCQAD